MGFSSDDWLDPDASSLAQSAVSLNYLLTVVLIMISSSNMFNVFD